MAEELQYLLSVPSPPCVLLRREVEDIADHATEDGVTQYLDLLPHTNSLDTARSELLSHLAEQLECDTEGENCLKIRMSWADLQSPESLQFKSYLENVSRFTYKQVKVLIDAQMRHWSPEPRDTLYEEVLQHWKIASDFSHNFSETNTVSEKIREYLLSKTRLPLVISGSSGAGKSTAVASAALDTVGWLRDGGHTLNTGVVLRFCGLTRESQDIRSLIRTLCYQTAYAMGLKMHKVPRNLRAMQRYFRDMLGNGAFRGLLVIYLDGLDLISPSMNAHMLDWLPLSLPNNVKLVISASTTHSTQLLQRLHSKYPENGCFVEIPALQTEAATDLLADNLLSAGRVLHRDAQEVCTVALKESVVPLAVELLSDLAQHWCSYECPTAFQQRVTEETLFSMIIEHTERKYGSRVVVHCLSYITISDGISEAELIDVLSLDEDVLEEVLEDHTGAIRRFPAYYWARIYMELQSLFRHTSSDQAELISWKNHLFRPVFENMYLEDAARRRYFHSVMSDYYLGRGSSVAQPITSVYRDDSPLRYVPQQPLSYGNSGTTNCVPFTAKPYNYRVLHQLPYHLSKAGRHEELDRRVLFNYGWLRAKLQAVTIEHILYDYGTDARNDQQVKIVKGALEMSAAALSSDHTQLAPELVGRLLPYIHTGDKVRMLVEDCDLHGMQSCPYIPKWQTLRAPETPLSYTVQIGLKETTNGFIKESQVYCHGIETDDSYMVLCKENSSNNIKLWNLEHAYETPGFGLQRGGVLAPSSDGRLLCCFTERGTMDIYDMVNGRKTFEIKHGKTPLCPSNITASAKYVAYTFPTFGGPHVADLNAGLELKSMSYKCSATAISDDEQLLAFMDGPRLIIADLPLLKKKLVKDLQVMIRKIIFRDRQGTSIYILTEQNEVRHVKLNLKHKDAEMSGIVCQNVDVQDVALSHDRSMVLVSSLFSLTVIQIHRNNIKKTIKEMPGDFTATSTAFTSSGFSHDDRYVIACRHNALGLWDAASGAAVKLLHLEESPIQKIFLSNVGSVVATLHQNSVLQVWNLDNVNSPASYTEIGISGAVAQMASDSRNRHVICRAEGQDAATILDASTGRNVWRLAHPFETSDPITDVLISPCGCYAATSKPHHQGEVDEDHGELLQATLLWDVKRHGCLIGVPRNRYTVLGTAGREQQLCRVLFFPCVAQDASTPTRRYFQLLICDVNEAGHLTTERTALPLGDICGTPILTKDGARVFFILCDDWQSTKLCIYSLDDKATKPKVIPVETLLGDAYTPGSQLLNIISIGEDKILMTVARRHDHMQHQALDSIDCSKPLEKCAVLFDHKHNIKTVINPFLDPASELESLVLSSGGRVLWHNGKIFDTKSGQLLQQFASLQHCLPSQVIFLCDGQYLAGISRTRKTVLLYRTRDGKRLCEIFLHGAANVLASVMDDRTILVGCTDSRVVAHSLLFGDPDPIRNIIKPLESRRGETRGSETEHKTDYSQFSYFQLEDGDICLEDQNEVIDLTKEDLLGSDLSSLVEG